MFSVCCLTIVEGAQRRSHVDIWYQIPGPCGYFGNTGRAFLDPDLGGRERGKSMAKEAGSISLAPAAPV